MKTRKERRKPSGKVSGRVLTVGHGPAELSEEVSFKFPELKGEIEAYVMNEFQKISQSSQNDILRVNSVEHFDTVHNPDAKVILDDGSEAYFELFEVAPLMASYKESQFITIGDLNEFVWDNINKKAEKYGPRSDIRPINLLIYATFSNFMPYELEAKCLMDSLQKMKTSIFGNVYLIIFNFGGEGMVFKLWPFVGRNFTNSQLVGHLRRKMLRPKFEKCQIVADKSIGERIDATVRIYYPKDADIGAEIASRKLGVVDGFDPIHWMLPIRVRPPKI